MSYHGNLVKNLGNPSKQGVFFTKFHGNPKIYGVLLELGYR